jgi:lipid A 3-O-deacylase
MRFKLFTFLFCFLGTASVFAQSHTTEIGIQTDNDSYLAQGSDRYYTDGIFIYYRQALTVKGNANTALSNKILGFEAGQKIFNPQSGFVPAPQYVDRPFAGYSYIGATLNFLYSNESNLKLGAQLGIVGPGSGAEATQNFIHKTFGFYTPGGWQYQIKNDAELNLSAEYDKLIVRGAWIDLSITSYANLGNGFSGAGIGPLVRIGSFNQLFNSVSTKSTAIRNKGATPLHVNELFFYYKPQFNYVAYDATIQGGLFDNHNDPNNQEIILNKEPFIFSNQVGLAFTTSRFVFDIAAIFHTLDDKEMVQSHQWGSVTVMYRFK